MRNVQVSIDEETLRNVDRAAEPLGLTRSEIVRQALRQWLHRRAVDRFEQDWIAALQQTPDEATRAEAWLASETWSRR
jgi:metal-responsive CopG/Arc/MetJ family transcriptional regulator